MPDWEAENGTFAEWPEFPLSVMPASEYPLPMVYPVNNRQCFCGVRFVGSECPRCKREKAAREDFQQQERVDRS